MKSTARLVCLSMAALLAASSCTTLGSMVGIASEEYVDARIAEVRIDLQQTQASVGEVDAEVERISEVLTGFEATAAEIEEALVAVDRAVATTEELRRLADVLEQRLQDLPNETIRRLITILEEYLDQ